MILKKINSRIHTVNLFADFILSKIPTSEDSIITASDCKNFIVIKGITSSNNILDINSITTEFNDKYNPKFPISHTIDLIEYNKKLSEVTELSFTLHKSENCSYHKYQIKEFLSGEESYSFEYQPMEITDDLLITTSEFPHGYSLNQGRLIYYYGKHIFYSIPTNYPVSSISLKLSTVKNEENENIISVYNPHKEMEDEVLKSAILDVFDFDMSWLSTEMKKVDWSIELTNPLEEYSFIKKRNKDFVIF
jgi:hypothetical protein